ncbi:uncharacterized protein LOC115022691 isoform X2 [Cottoperca gobio]|uniref:Uncharacterized protein LOC115022691 isoform X2 n=1 Tax=Cottoperca gobio TaxID=56716 RepID=A0A6J2RHC3_COTGO|nr:uncharacterized protein LOC115022691 isoform X2 [Cottoperca gobio]
MATAAVNRTLTAHPAPNGVNLHTHANNGGPTSEQQEPGLHCASQDPGLSSHPQHHFPARPFFYVHAPPPPPFFHYQWPMPFSYNPFAGFPGMGYGMVMPPFPPPPYMEAPAYILPHPHLQPVDYRRLLHPQVHVPSVPYQNPNPTHRSRPPHTGPVRETVNSEVQTEPTHRGVGGYGVESPLVGSDSGRGTASNSPSPSSSSSQKQGAAEVKNYTLPSSNAKCIQVKRTSTSSTVKHGFNVLHPKETKTVQSCIRATLETQSGLKDSVGQGNGHCNMWSVSSPDSMVPVCSSSQQEEEVVKERRTSVPDILMSWGGGTPQAKMLTMADELRQNDHQLPSYETQAEHKAVHQSATGSKDGPVVADCAYANDDAEDNLSFKDSATLFKILKLREAYKGRRAESRRDNEPVGLVGSVRPCLPCRDELPHSRDASHKLPDNEQENGNETNPYEDTTESIPYQINTSSQMRTINESVWSVESLAPFIPNEEWLLQHNMFEPDVIVEMTEEDENARLSLQNDDVIVKSSKERPTCRLIFSSPAEKQSPPKKPEMERDIDTSEMRSPKQGQSMTPSEKDHSASLTHLQSKIILSTPTEEDVDKNGSSEPEADRSPNQESLIVNEQQKRRPCSPEQEEALFLISAAGEKIYCAGQPILQNGVATELVDEACGNEEDSRQRNEQLCVPMADQKMAEVSPSKGHLVDCGVQCTELKEWKCPCEEMRCMGPSRRHPFKYPDMKKANNGHGEGLYMKGQIQKNQRKYWKNRGQATEKQSSQQEGYAGYCGKPGKPQVCCFLQVEMEETHGTEH